MSTPTPPESKKRGGSQDPDKIETRREMVYDLHLMNYSARQISETLTKRGTQAARRTVADDIAFIRKRNLESFNADKHPEERLRHLYQQLEDKYRRMETMGWQLFYATPADQTTRRSAILGEIRSTVDGLGKIFQSQFENVRIAELEALAAKVRENMQEQRVEREMRTRILPVQGS